MKDFSKLRSLLESEERFPLPYLLKFIGRNSPRFGEGVQAFERKFPDLKLQARRESAKAKHVSLTYGFVATDPDQVIDIYREASELPDLLVIL
jgi:putative lipoic acid-binding regulatory protein